MNAQQIRRQLLLDIEKLKAPEGYLYAGFPNFFAPFGRDSLIVALQLLPVVPEIPAATLRMLARYQAEEEDAHKDADPGKIFHEYRLDPAKQQELSWGWPYYGSVDATPLFLIVFAEYVALTHDTILLQELWPNACEALKWIVCATKKNPYGFLAYERKNPHGLFHQGWKDAMENHLRITPPVALAEVQGYAYKACNAFDRLAMRLLAVRGLGASEVGLINTALACARAIKQNFSAHFWMPGEQFFAIGIDGDGNQRKAIASNAGHLLACDDLLTKEEARAVVRRLFMPEMWTIGGIRTLSTNDPDFDPFSYHLGSVWPHDNWMIYTGLLARDFTTEARKVKNALLRIYRTLGNIPELCAVINESGTQKIVPVSHIAQLETHNAVSGRHLHSVQANPLQAWAIGALLNMLS